MFIVIRYLSFWCALCACLAASAKPLQIDALRFWTAPDHTRLVFDINQQPEYAITQISNPQRLVIDFKNAKLRHRLQQPPVNQPLFAKVRSSIRNNINYRVVLDLKTPVNIQSFYLTPSHQYGNRLVIDMEPKDKPSPSLVTYRQKPKATKTIQNNARDIIIAVDAGHGGEDPGARGPRGTQEKKVVLQIARKLAALIGRQPGMRAVLVRKGDYYIDLRKRIEIAREARADLFVSIHADAFTDSKVKGASVFTLSRRGASSEMARWLANHENKTDLKLAGGVTLDDKDKDLASVLLDLSLSASKEASQKVAEDVLFNIKKINILHQKQVQKARFIVLKSPDIPSILVETAFISNPHEEQKLNSRHHQQKMAQAIFQGVLRYFKHNPPIGTLMAMRANNPAQHVIQRGETLSEIAQKYGVSLQAIKVANALASNVIFVGQVLTIPAGS